MLLVADTERFPVSRAFLLEELSRTLAFSRTRCWTWVDIRPRIAAIWQDKDAEQIISRLAEIDLGEMESCELGEELAKLRLTSEKVRGVDRPRTDRLIVRLTRFLPPDERCSCALLDITHTRKPRREGALKTLRNSGLRAEFTAQVLRAYEAAGDQNLLKLIARSGTALSAVDPFWLVAELEDPYWQMRVIMELLLQKDERGVEARRTCPRAFVHAVGRIKAVALVGYVEELVRANRTDYSFLDLAAWTFGRLAHSHGLDMLQVILDSELAMESTNRSAGEVSSLIAAASDESNETV